MLQFNHKYRVPEANLQTFLSQFSILFFVYFKIHRSAFTFTLQVKKEILKKKDRDAMYNIDKKTNKK